MKKMRVLAHDEEVPAHAQLVVQTDSIVMLKNVKRQRYQVLSITPMDDDIMISLWTQQDLVFASVNDLRL